MIKTAGFKRDYKKYKRQHYPVNKILDVVDKIRSNNNDELVKHKPHKIFKRNCYVLHVDRSVDDNWLLMYKQENNSTKLLGLGSHDEINQMAKRVK